MPMMTTDRLVAETLSGYGVTHIFFVPSVLSGALAEMEDLNIRRVTTHHEIAAAYMADGFARASHRPGVCMAQSVGAPNLAAGLRDAFLASSPVIAISGGPHPDTRYRYVYQQIEDFSMYDSVTKFNARVEKSSRLPDLLRQAFREATTGAPGPVHLEIPGRVAEGLDGTGEFHVIIEEQFKRFPAYRQQAEMARIRKAADLLAAAERPVIVAGGGVALSEAAAEVVRLAEILSIPVAASPSGKGTIPEGHPLSIGMVGTYGRRCANQIVQEADLVFFVGTRAGGMTTNGWKTPPSGAQVIQLDIDPAEIGRNYPVQEGLLGDAKATLERLIEVVTPAPPRLSWLQRAQELKDGWRAEMAAMMNSDASPMRPERICREITESLPENAVVVADTGHASYWSGTMIELNSPGQRFIRCAGTLGWAFPASIGVKCALPDRPVLCFVGDGGFYPHMVELETAARQGINVIVLVNNNAALGSTQRGFDEAYGGTQRGKAREMWVFEQTNFAKAAESLGCLGIRVERASELRSAMEVALTAHRPTVIDMVSDRDALAH
jgi:acetolactate synthase I/II/III large subunit